MGRPKKLIGHNKNIECTQCGKETKEGYRLTLEIYPIEITEDFFLSYDSNVEEYDSTFCSKECLIQYIGEILQNVR